MGSSPLGRSPTGRALIGASTAMAVGLTIGAVARSARGTHVGVASVIARSAPGRLAALFVERLAQLQPSPRALALGALALTVAVALGAAGRAVVLWRRGRSSAAPIIALAAAGATPAEIARRAGLSRDVIALAAHLGA